MVDMGESSGEKKNENTAFWGLLASFLVATSGTAQAGLVPISQPTAEYISSTTLISITDTDSASVDSLSDGNLTISFSHFLLAGTAPGRWGGPPDTESDTPRILVDVRMPPVGTYTLTFSQPLSIFGLEVWLLQSTVTLEFYNGDDLVGSINRDVNEDAGARLFAASATDGDVFTKVVLTMEKPAGFRTAQFRYALASVQAAVPEPSTLVLVMIGPLGFGYLHLRRRVRVL